VNFLGNRSEIYADRVEIVNPGGLPRGVTVENFGRISIRRNEIIADLFFRLHKCERAGSGIRRMRKALAAAGLSGPRFEPDEHFFRIIFDRPRRGTEEGRIPETVPAEDQTSSLKLALKTSLKSTVKTASAILEVIKKEPGITIPEMAKELSVSVRTVHNHIRRMKAAGLLRRVGPDKGGHWQVISRGEKA